VTVHAPIIVIGMHRSGTSLVMQLLDRLGVFPGWRLQSNHEAMLFCRLNRWVMNQAGASWDNPAPTHDLIACADLMSVVGERLRAGMSGMESIEYLGPRLWVRYRSVPALAIPWGWKDPRTTFTLPLWLDLFPQALCVNVFRHGVDVAASLKTRRDKDLIRREEITRSLAWRAIMSRRTADSAGLTRCATLDGGFSLWLEYMEEAGRHAATLGERCLDVRYETLLEDPEAELRRIATFCGLERSADSIARVARQVTPGRRYAFRQDAALDSFATRQSEDLARFGY